jgi:hypothetical protein
MRVEMNYVTPLLVAGASTVAIAAAPTAVASPASALPAGIAAAPTAPADHGGGHGGSYCGDYCGSYTAYDGAGYGGSHAGGREIGSGQRGRAYGPPLLAYLCSRFRCALPNRG